MREEDEEDSRNTDNCLFCEKNFESDKIRDPCHLTSKNRGLAHSKINGKITEKQSIFASFIFHIFTP